MNKNRKRETAARPENKIENNDLITENQVLQNESTDIDLQLIYDIIKKENINRPDRYLTIDKLTKNKIRTLIGKWFPPSGTQMTIMQVVNDIYIRINEGVEGRKNYYTGKPTANRKYGRYEYILIIRQKTVLFIDENREICYIIKNTGG